MLTECRFSRSHPRFRDDLDVIKFLCKDMWIILYGKQIDNLKTNHKVGSGAGHGLQRQGVFVLTDKSFRWFQHMSLPASMAPEAGERAQKVGRGVLPGTADAAAYLVPVRNSARRAHQPGRPRRRVCRDA